MYTLYIVQCADGTLYTGITTDVTRRVREHNGSPKGAKYTRARRPVRLVYTKNFRSKSHAQQQEAAVKQLSRAKKRELIASPIPHD